MMSEFKEVIDQLWLHNTFEEDPGRLILRLPPSVKTVKSPSMG